MLQYCYVELQSKICYSVLQEVKKEVESAIFWGYGITQIPGGFLAAKYPANKLFGAAIGLSSLLNLLIPLIYTERELLWVLKFVQGLVEVKENIT